MSQLVFHEPVYSLEEAAKELGISVRTLRNHVANLLIRVVQFAPTRGARVITKTELERFKKERRPVGNPAFVKTTRAKRGA